MNVRVVVAEKLRFLSMIYMRDRLSIFASEPPGTSDRNIDKGTSVRQKARLKRQKQGERRFLP